MINRGYIWGGIIIVLLSIVFLGTRTIVSVEPTATGTSTGANVLKVSASFYPLYFFASQIGGDKATVTNITPAGAEPHDYEPSPRDMARIQDSGIVILNGGGLEAWGNDVQKNIDPEKTTVVVAGEGLTTQKVEEDGATIVDPHIWQSPELAAKMVDKIVAAFEIKDPANAGYYADNAAALKLKLEALDAEFRTGVQSCASKDIVTSHAAFGYLATEFGLNQVPIAGLSPDAEPSPRQLADVAKYAKEHTIKYIFFESLVSPKLSETVATEIGAQTLVLDPIEGISDADSTAGKDYFTVMRANLANLKIALQCQN